MTEREQLIQSGDYDVGNWSEADTGFTQDQEMLFAGEDLTIDPSDPMQDPAQLERMQTQTQAAAYDNWINSKANQALLQKYGVAPDVYSDSGDRFKWNGSAYVKVEDKSTGFTDYVKTAMVAGLALAASPALAGAFQSAGLGSVASAASGAAASSAITQAITTGELDLRDMVVAAATAGMTQGLNDWLNESNILRTVDDQAQRYLEIADEYATNPAFGTGSAPYLQAMEEYNRITQGIEAVGSLGQSADTILNLAQEAGWLANTMEELSQNPRKRS